MNFRQFEAFYWICRLGNFHAAARHLKASQPAISTRIPEMPLTSLAKTIRNKNAGVDTITFDVNFADRASFNLAPRSGVLSREAVRRLFGIPDSRISDHVEFERRGSPSSS